MTEYSTGSNVDDPSESPYGALVNPHDVAPAEQGEISSRPYDTTEREPEVVEYDPRNIPEITTQQISDIEHLVTDMYVGNAQDAEIQAAVAAKLMEIGIDLSKVTVRDDGTVVMRVKGEDGEPVRAIDVIRDFGTYDNGVTLVEAATGDMSSLDVQELAEDTQETQVEDAREDVQDALEDGGSVEEQSIDVPSQEEHTERIAAIERYEEEMIGYADQLSKLGQPDNLNALLGELNGFRGEVQQMFDGMAGVYGPSTGMPSAEALLQLGIKFDRDLQMTHDLDAVVAEDGARLEKIKLDIAEAKRVVEVKLQHDGALERTDKLHTKLQEIVTGIEGAFKDISGWRATRDEVNVEADGIIEAMIRNSHHDQGMHEFLLRISRLTPKLTESVAILSKAVGKINGANTGIVQLTAPFRQAAQREYQA